MNFQKLVLLIALAVPLSASALVMRSDGPEPIIVQIKESLRASDDLDNRLNEIVTTRNQNRLSVTKWWAGSKLLVMLSFPANFTERQANTAIAKLQQLPAVEKVVAVSAANLEFKPGDFARSYGANDTIPDVARRGFDAERIGRKAYRAPDQMALLSTPHVADRLIVRWKPEHVWHAERTGFKDQIAAFNREAHCRVVREDRHSPTTLTQVLESEDVSLLADKLKKYMDSGWVVYAQPDYLYKPEVAPNDPAYQFAPGAQWNLKKISAEAAWDITRGLDGDAVKIAIGDTGANIGHTDFSSNLWSGQTDPNQGAKNFYDHNTDVHDEAGHGSNVAAIAGAQGNNGRYMTGVAWDVSLMILKVFSPGTQPFAPSDVIAEAIDYARIRGVAAMNLSLGSLSPIPCEYENGRLITCYEPEYDGVLYDALVRARDSGMIIVSSAGNNRGGTNFYTHEDLGNNDSAYNVANPASIPTDNNISVLATTSNDALASYSSYGARNVDIGAPGGAGTAVREESVIGLEPSEGNDYDFSDPQGPYSYFSGTSMAAPHVTGAISLIKSRFPWENYRGLRDRVLMGTDRTGTLEGLCRTNGRLNVYKALQTRSMLRNLSTRARVEDGDRVLIAGFVIGGSSSGSALKVGIRGLGPSVGVSVARLGNPRIELYNGAGTLIDANNNWYEDWNAADTTASGLQPSNNSEAAMVRWLNPGAYTVILRDEGSQYGVGLFEIYELQGNTNEQSRLVNLSSRCLVGTGDEQAIVGTLVGDFNNTGLPKPDRRVLIVGKGPSLGAFGLQGTLSDPQLSVSNMGLYNNNWVFDEELSTAGLEPAHYLESALWPTFAPASANTVVLSGVNGATGIGSIEFYEY